MGTRFDRLVYSSASYAEFVATVMPSFELGCLFMLLLIASAGWHTFRICGRVYSIGLFLASTLNFRIDPAWVRQELGGS
jgi:hypothetical protein